MNTNLCELLSTVNKELYNFYKDPRVYMDKEIMLLRSLLEKAKTDETVEFIISNIIDKLETMSKEFKVKEDREEIFYLIQNTMVNEYSANKDISVFSDRSNFEVHTKNGIFLIKIETLNKGEMFDKSSATNSNISTEDKKKKTTTLIY